MQFEPEWRNLWYLHIALKMQADPWWTTVSLCYPDSCGRVYRAGFRIDGNEAKGEIRWR